MGSALSKFRTVLKIHWASYHINILQSFFEPMFVDVLSIIELLLEFQCASKNASMIIDAKSDRYSSRDWKNHSKMFIQEIPSLDSKVIVCQLVLTSEVKSEL